MTFRWPNNNMDLSERLSELLESPEKPSAEEMASDAPDDKKTQEKAKEKTEDISGAEEYNGIDPLTWIEYRDGKEYHYRKDIT